MAEGDEVEQEALNMLIARICELEGKRMRGRIWPSMTVLSMSVRLCPSQVISPELLTN